MQNLYNTSLRECGSYNVYLKEMATCVMDWTKLEGHGRSCWVIVMAHGTEGKGSVDKEVSKKG